MGDELRRRPLTVILLRQPLNRRNPRNLSLMIDKRKKWTLMEDSKTSQRLWGSFFLTFGVLSFVGFLYAAVISKLLPLSDHPFISALQRDRYYYFLVPLSIPVLVVAVYFHWLSMKLFKHA